MNIKLYKFENNNFVLKAIIDDIQQISWEHNLYSAGQFTISINYNIPNARLFERGLFVQFENDPYMFGEISTITNSIGQNGKGSEMLNISGYDARYLFKRRVIKNLNNNETWSMTAKGELCMRNLVADQCGSNAEIKRRLPITNIMPSSSRPSMSRQGRHSTLPARTITPRTSAKLTTIWKLAWPPSVPSWSVCRSC